MRSMVEGRRIRYPVGMNDKRELRAAMRAERKRLAGLNPEAASRAAEHLPGLLDALFATTTDFAAERARRAFVAAVYRAQGSELDTVPLSRALQQAGVGLALPVVIERDAPLIFRRWRLHDPLELDVAGVPAPLPLAEAVTPDVVFIPLLAFDLSGGRLGQGGGYYDRTLEALRAARLRPWFVGLAYAGQEADILPRERHDQPLDGVLTEVGYTPARKV